MQLWIERRWFCLGLILLCCTYLLFEFFLNAHLLLSVDEFWFAHRIYQYRDRLPYRDFAPYKTVLGYYLLLLPLLVTKGIMQTLIFTKNIIALSNTLILFCTAYWLKKFFSSESILIGLSLLITSELFLFYSTQIRVDLLGYWFCFFSLLLLLDKRFVLAGLFLGLGFITTQKALWYFFGSNVALVICWLMLDRKIHTLWKITKFNLLAASCIIFYLVFWSTVANWHTVIHSMFNEARVMYQLDWYESSRKLFWAYVILYNPLLFLLAPISLLSIFVKIKDDPSYPQRLLITLYAITILLCLIPYKQVFPYYMQVTIPVFFTLYTAFFSWYLQLLHSQIILPINQKILWLIVTAHAIFVITIILAFHLPIAYLLISFIPLLFGIYLSLPPPRSKESTSLWLKLIGILILFNGIIYPVLLYIPKIISLNGRYQKANIQAVDLLLRDGSDYVAGIELIYNKTQKSAGLRHLMGPAIDYLYSPTAKLRSVMIASLYEDPSVTKESIINNLKKSDVKFYVNNYRMMALPTEIKQYLHHEYEHLFGSIYIYAPTIKPLKSKLTLKFSGRYLIETAARGSIILNGKPYQNNALYYFKQGEYFSDSQFSYRLKLIPSELPLFWNADFIQDKWETIIG